MKLTSKVQAAFSLALLLMFVASLYGLWGLNRAFNDVAGVSDRVYQQEREVRSLENEFRVQVQEWKNVLLRGFDTKDFKKYWGKFEAREKAVQDGVATLLKSQTDPAIRSRLEQFLVAHRKLGTGYREAAQLLINNDFVPRFGDRAVRGQDREPGELIGSVADLIAAEGQAATLAARERVSRLYVTTSLALGVFLLSGFLISTVLIRGILRTLGGDPSVLSQAVVQLRDGNYASLRSFSEQPLTGVLAGMESLGQTLDQQHQDVARHEKEVERIWQALAAVDSAMLVANSSGEIVYRNPAITDLLEGLSAQGVRAQDSQLASLLSHLGGIPPNSRGHAVTVGSTELLASLSAIRSASGLDLGSVLELRDRTAEVSSLRQLQQVLASASRGDLSARLSGAESGFFGAIAREVNDLLGTVEHLATDLQQVLASIADGNLDVRVRSDYTGQFAGLFSDCERTVDSLTDVLGRIQQASATIEQVSGEIASGNESLHARTSEQADALERTTAGMNQVQGTVQQNSLSAQDATRIADAACKRAERGGAVVGQAMAAMAEANEASKQIADIITVIDEIAFQTNLLALNAAVEAAHAGEHGRGFAIVAAEVQNLAQRSATAAREISSLISDTVEKVQQGSALVNESGEELTAIVESVGSVNDIVASIAAASAEQSEGIGHIALALSEIESSTQQNSALVEQIGSTSLQMRQQVNALQELGGYFQTRTLHRPDLSEWRELDRA